MPNYDKSKKKMLQSYKGKGMGGKTELPAPKALKLHEGISDKELEKYRKDLDKFKRRKFELEQKKKKEAIEFYKSLRT
jgi:hypothetical protein